MIVIVAILALVAIVFGVQQGVRYFLRAQPAQTEPDLVPIPSPTFTFDTVDQPSIPTPLPAYSLRHLQEFLNAMGTADPQWDLNKDGIVNETDLAIFKIYYQP